MPLSLKQFSYHLPPEKIAQSPAEPRDSSKLLMLNRHTGALSHHIFKDLARLLKPGDVIVRNNTKVIPARLFGTKSTGGAVEVVLNKKIPQKNTAPQEEVWECLTKPGLKPGQVVRFSDTLSAHCLGNGSSDYTRLVSFSLHDSAFFAELQDIGEMPLPPYIQSTLSKSALEEKYQTTFANEQHTGSVAAPTAGLHFTPELDRQLEEFGVDVIELTLHVGLGTFLPVKSEDVTKHHMHAEQFVLSGEAATKLNAAKRAGSRIIAVGTTTVRTLESCVTDSGYLEAKSGDTEIFLYPPYRYRFVDGIITNFHLPESTLLMLVSAFVSAPNTETVFETFEDSSIGKAYAEAINSNYRFFSFGDAILIL